MSKICSYINYTMCSGVFQPQVPDVPLAPTSTGDWRQTPRRSLAGAQPPGGVGERGTGSRWG